ncbi:DUF294 nucleotidyltransferase-like domain-containing protein [Paenibacillus sp. p3-SID1389]|uniref:DUF294 nucleotidyltransferase-like domain-containing protein n=1 Tax=Paenibacillus sp. p3-SID1389 TaxID=2916364 RepID=UPI0021A3CAFA|nr:DUF294 nucleotidyltransferase-like domain-containing protein [Paenibacillus sp. p3-SID1389]MCT2194175.1 DUF294 nucleotidyltransferase-like domain-containing protein [Paenibacillus sp. p3-SID1389]
MSHETAMNNANLSAIRSAATPGLLRAARIDEQNRLYSKLTSMPIQDWNREVSDLHDAVMTQACRCCEEEMIQEGFGPPPSHYAFIAFGSAGRAEPTLWSDQDNGLIYGDGDADQLEVYFEIFGQKLSEILEQVGYPPCPGRVMVSNPLWRGNFASWEKQLLEWRDILAWEQVRYLMIAADLRHICGNAELTAGLRKTMKRIMEADQGGERDVVAAILRNTVRHKAALNVLGQVITEQSGEHAGEFDVKYGLYIPIVNAVRYLALQYGIEASNTWERIAQLLQLEAVPTRWLESCSRAFNTAVKLRSLVSPVIEDGLLTGSHYLPQDMLKQKELRRELRESLSTVKVMYRTLQRQHRYAERKWL